MFCLLGLTLAIASYTSLNSVVSDILIPRFLMYSWSTYRFVYLQYADGISAQILELVIIYF